LIRIDTKAGHGAGKPTTKQIEEVADRWGFLSRALQMDGAAPSLQTTSAPATAVKPAGQQ
jgi:prolyl oligopeptidase